MNDKRKIVASCSFGKDSLAAIIAAEEHGQHIDEAIYCKIMFNETISAELPEHEEFIYTKAIPLLENRYGIKTITVHPERTYCDQFYAKYKKGKKIGQIYGFPMRRGAWCNSMLKVGPISKLQNSMGGHIAVIGIAADEIERIDRKTENNKILPLVEYGITEADAFQICKEAGCLSPAYREGRKRLGCWFCHNQRIKELKRLRREHPELWKELLKLDKVSPCRFTQRSSVSQFERRFSYEDAQMTIFDFIKKESK